MAKYSVLIKPSAVKELEAIPKADRQRIASKIRQLSDDPRPYGSQKLSGSDLYRIRQGDFRMVYQVEDGRMIVLVIGIGNRRDVYRKYE